MLAWTAAPCARRAFSSTQGCAAAPLRSNSRHAEARNSPDVQTVAGSVLALTLPGYRRCRREWRAAPPVLSAP